MTEKYKYKCDNCGYSFYTSGPWEFYLDSEGRRKPYGRPKPISQEAKERGIYGLEADVYCLNCSKVFNIILTEFKKPISHITEMLTKKLKPKSKYTKPRKAKCPGCGESRLTIELDEEWGVLCPRCKTGKLVRAKHEKVQI